MVEHDAEEIYDLSAVSYTHLDPTKILIYTGNTDMTGKELMDILRKDWDMELEMASGYYALALTGIMDRCV